MDLRHIWPSSQKLLGSLLLLASILLGAGFMWSRVNGCQTTQPSENEIRQRISLLIHQAIQRATTRLKDGTYATTMPVVPSTANMHEVKGYGDRAVEILGGYVDSKSAMEQYVAFRFLLDFQEEPAFVAIKSFAERSAFGDVRLEATVSLGSFPEGKVKLVLERISTSDPNSDVRAAAGRALAHFQSAQGKEQKQP